ncbi:hypothetical protein BKA67DRAFT_551284, partial [Truncatella angustata]
MTLTNNPNGPISRKRAAPISVDEANKDIRLQDLNLYTPSSSHSSAFPGGAGDPRELICLCTKAPKVPRPRNGKYSISPRFPVLLPNPSWLPHTFPTFAIQLFERFYFPSGLVTVLKCSYL